MVGCNRPSKDADFLVSKNFDELADSPFICSNQLQRKSYTISDYKFNIWVNGDFTPDWDRWIKDFEKFTKKQIEKFIEFPVKEYHFNTCPSYKAYHGVTFNRYSYYFSHQKKLTILYKELWVSSHELYHTWNVKSIRPVDMLPYNFLVKTILISYIYENNYLYGGFVLLKSNVFS